VDADLALRTVEQLRTEIQSLGDRNVREVAHSTVAGGALDEVHAVPPASETPRLNPRTLLIAGGALVLLLAAWLLFFNKSKTEKGISQFEAGRYEQAEQTLRGVVAEDPGDARAAFYLALLYRRTQRTEEASTVLRRAIDKNPNDPFLREELGNLFMALGRPDLAAKQFRIAQEQDPDNPRYWVRLVTALREAGDPEAEAVLQRAPAEARALLQTAQ
jgi:tetratricopeptide (TPR) repeat protein